MNELFFFSTRILSLLVLAGAIIVAIRSWNSLAKEMKVLTIYLSLILVNEMISEAFIALGYQSNIFLFYIYSLFEIFLLSTVYFIVFREFSIQYLRGIILVVSFLIGLYIIYEGWQYVDKGINGVYGKSVSNLWIIILAGFYLINQLKVHPVKVKLHFDRINLMILFYFPISLVIFSIMSQLPSIGKESSYVIWGVNNIFCLLFYFVFLRTFSK